MASVPFRQCVACGLFVELWMPGALCSECAAFAPDSARPVMQVGNDIIVRPYQRGTLQAWKRAKAIELGISTAHRVEGRMFAGELLPEKWREYLYRWIGIRVPSEDEPPWPAFRVGDLCYQQWSRTVFFPDPLLWITARWHPDRGEWIETPAVSGKDAWNSLWKYGMAALREIPRQGRKPFISRYYPTRQEFGTANEKAKQELTETLGRKPTQYEIAAELNLSRSRFNDYLREYRADSSD